MNVRLRGHHLLCLLGYTGMGYSPGFVRNMTSVYERLRAEPSTVVEIVRGPDDLCACYPEDGPYHCDGERVHSRDDAVLEALGMRLGERTEWRRIVAAIRSKLTPDDIPRMCTTCPWLPYGVCEAGVARIAAGEGLAPLPRKNRSTAE